MVTGSLWEMVTGSLCFPFFLDIFPFGKWLREMVAGDGYGKEVFVFLFFLIFLLLGDGYGRWLREVFVFLSFFHSPFGGWLREMVTGSLWVMVTGDGYGKSLFSFFS